MEPNKQSRERFVQAPDPTPAEIREQCLAIQTTWSERERRYRAGAYGTPPPVEIHRCDVDACQADA